MRAPALSGVAWRNLAHRRGRSLSTATGVILGVALLVGVAVTNASVSAGFERDFDDAANRFDVWLRPQGAWGAAVPDAELDRIRALDGVAVVSPELPVNVTARDGEDETFTIRLFGNDLEPWQTTRPKAFDGIDFRPGTNEVLLNTAAARRLGVDVGADVKVSTTTGDHVLRVAGLHRPQAGDGDDWYFGVVDRAFAAAVSQRPGVFEEAVLVLDDGVDPGVWVGEHRRQLPGFELADVGDGGVSPLLGAVQGALTFTAAIGIFVGAFLIYLTLSMAVLERTPIYGSLRALGSTRRQVRQLVLAESLALGVVAAVGGTIIGLLLSRVLVRLMVLMLEIRQPPTTIPPSVFLLALVCGVGVSVVAAWAPSRRAAHMSPVDAMKAGAVAVRPSGRRVTVTGVVLFALGLAMASRATIAAMSVGSLIALLGAVLVVPALLAPLARALGSVTARIRPGVGDVAVMHLVKERSRSAYTLALVMVVLAMVFTIGASHSAMARAMDTSMEKSLGADLQVGSNGTFDPTLEEQLRTLPDVTASTAMRWGQATLDIPDGGRAADPADDTRDVELMIVEPSSFFSVLGLVWDDGDDASVVKALDGGGSAVMSVSVATELGLARGDEFTIHTSEGPQPFRLAGVYRGFVRQQPLVVGLPDGRKWFGADRAHGLALDITDGREAATRQAIEDGPGEANDLWITDRDESRANAHTQLRRSFLIFYVVLGVAGIIGAIGLANTLSMSVLTRRREIGVLRAIGTTARQIRAMVAVEAATLVLVATALALPLGGILAVLFTAQASKTLGFTVTYSYPWRWAVSITVIALLTGLVAVLFPARRAGRLNVVQSLQFD